MKLTINDALSVPLWACYAPGGGWVKQRLFGSASTSSTTFVIISFLGRCHSGGGLCSLNLIHLPLHQIQRPRNPRMVVTGQFTRTVETDARYQRRC
jgi:hypothetical protein